jgi:hypothetical protein
MSLGNKVMCEKNLMTITREKREGYKKILKKTKKNERSEKKCLEKKRLKYLYME